jgi:hypothetical protein
MTNTAMHTSKTNKTNKQMYSNMWSIQGSSTIYLFLKRYSIYCKYQFFWHVIMLLW